ncbi:MAG: hypothetical protein L6V35_08505 [Alistipes putredinis]|nr:MAG: hypothetical protein L6V35_08505 [Alistipes putredinis]
MIPDAEPLDIIRRYERMNTTILETEAEGADYVSDIILNAVKRSNEKGEKFVLGITTGKSPLGIYRRLVEKYNAGGVSFANVSVFSLDEPVSDLSETPFEP